MKNNIVSITAFIFVILAIVGTIALFVFEKGVRQLDWIDLEAAALACLSIAALGCILGWCSFKTSAGKMAAILGTLTVAFFLFQLMRSGDEGPSPRPLSKSVDPGNPPAMTLTEAGETLHKALPPKKD